jgi:hypothetical protein
MLAAGYTDDELRRMRAGEQLVALRPGAYIGGDDARLRTPADRHLLEIEAALQQDALRDTGRQVVRWIWAELSRFEAVVERLERAFHRNAR